MAAQAAPRPPGPPKRKKIFLPPQEPIVIVQPPQHLAHLSGDALTEALKADRSEKWFSARAAAECGREAPTFRSWVSARYKYEEARAAAKAEADRTGTRPKPVRRPQTKMTPVPDGYVVRSPWWYAGTLRNWFMQEQLMRVDGTFVPYKPTGRTPGSQNRVQRTGSRPMQDMALEVLAAFEELQRKGDTIAAARAALAKKYKLSEKQVTRRLETGRKLRLAAADLTVTVGMDTTEARARLEKARELLLADGRRRNSNESRLRDAIAARTGADRSFVDHVLDGEPAVAT